MSNQRDYRDYSARGLVDSLRQQASMFWRLMHEYRKLEASYKEGGDPEMERMMRSVNRNFETQLRYVLETLNEGLGREGQWSKARSRKFESGAHRG